MAKEVSKKIDSAQKAYQQSLKRRTANTARKSALKTSMKKLLVALEQPADTTENLEQLLRSVSAQLARARSKKVMKRNTASRTLSRLAKKVAAAQRPQS